MTASLLELSATSYQRHALHEGERAWLETNCYVDLWIEVLHAYGFDPHAMLAFCLASDFEGDQWLFFKPPPAELALLYGVDVQELDLWRDLLDHAALQLSRGRLLLVEVDAYYLPDTQGVSYRRAHAKTTIGIERLDCAERRLGYFHNAGYFELSGEDFDGLFEPSLLVPYTEYARVDRERALRGPKLVAASCALLKTHAARLPRENPIAAMRAAFEHELPWLMEQPQATFHQYAFATLRQCGAAYELGASYLRWLSAQGIHDLRTPIEACDALSSQAKTLQFKLARAVVLKKPVEFAPMFEAMEKAWESLRTGLSEWLKAGVCSPT